MAKHEEKSRGAHVKREPETPAETRRRTRSTPDALKAPRRSAPKRETARKSADFEEDFAPRPAPKKRRSRKARRRRALRRLRSALILLFSLLLALGAGALYAGSCVSNSDTNLPNVYIKGINVSGLSQEQTVAALNAQGWERDAAVPLAVTLPAGVSFTVDRLESGAVLSAHRMAQAAFAYGHTGSWLNDLRAYLASMANPVDRGDAAAELDEGYIAQQVRGGLDAFNALSAEAAGYEVDKENAALVMRKGAGALQLSEEKLTAAVRQALLNGETALAYTELENLPSAPDFAAIYQSLAVEPQDAYYIEGTWDVVDEIVGCSFDVGQAAGLWNAAGWLDEVRVPLTITYPEVTGESLRSILFRDLLGSQTTYFPYSVPNRVSNINLAASKLNGIVLNPGDSLSYNTTLGQRTLDAGFLEAGAYSDGEVVEEVGGGICQVSSTLYCAEVMANLETVNRTNHYFRVDYLPIGFDATVSWPNPDFVFRNNRDYPVKIVTYCDTVERFITVEIWGTNVDGTHVELRNDGVYTIYDTEYPGTAIGTATTTFRDLYDAEGNLIATTKERYSDYHKHPEDIDWPPEKYAAEAAEGAAEVTFG